MNATSRHPGRTQPRRSTRGKVALSIPRELLDAAHREVEAGRAPSLSALVSEALAEKLERGDLEAVLAAMDTEYGLSTAEDEAWARRVLGL